MLKKTLDRGCLLVEGGGPPRNLVLAEQPVEGEVHQLLALARELGQPRASARSVDVWVAGISALCGPLTLYRIVYSSASRVPEDMPDSTGALLAQHLHEAGDGGLFDFFLEMWSSLSYQEREGMPPGGVPSLSFLLQPFLLDAYSLNDQAP